MKRDFPALNAFIRGQEFDLVQKIIVLPDGKDSTYHDQPCPSCGGKDRFYFFAEKGTFHCRQCDFRGDLIDLIAQEYNVSKIEAFDIVAQAAGYVDGAISTKTVSQKSETEKVPPFQTFKLQEDSIFKQAQRHRPEIGFADYKRAGAKLFRYGSQSGIAIPIYANDGEISGWVRYGTDGSKKISKGAKSGIVGKDARDNLLQKRQVKIAFKTPGVSDCLVLSKAIAEAELEDDYYAFTNGAGEGENPDKFEPMLRPALEGISVAIIADNDKAGEAGARKWAEFFVKFAKAVRVIQPPMERDGKQIKDLRDYIAILNENGEDIIKTLRSLAKNAEPITSEVVASWKQADGQSKNKNGLKGKVKLTPFTEIEDREQEWFMHNKIPAYDLAVFFAPGGCGKTYFVCRLAAHVTNGTPFPDGHSCTMGNVIFFPPEGQKSALKRRLKANGVDMTKCFLIERTEAQITLENSKEIEEAIDEIEQKSGLPCPLIIVDPVLSFTGKKNPNLADEVRDLLVPLQNLADRRKVTIILVTHPGKSEHTTSKNLVLSSVAWTDVPRSVWQIFQDKEDKDLRYLAPSKTNDCFNPTTVSFRITRIEGQEEGLVQIDRMDIDKTADDFMREQWRDQRGRPSTELAFAQGWLLAHLTDGEKKQKAIQKAAEAAGIKGRTLDSAKAELGVESKKHGFSTGSHFVWKLPSKSPPLEDT